MGRLVYQYVSCSVSDNDSFSTFGQFECTNQESIDFYKCALYLVIIVQKIILVIIQNNFNYYSSKYEIIILQLFLL